MRNVLGIILIVAGVAFGVYVGVWICFIGGIVQIVDAVKATPVSGVDIGLGILRIVIAGMAGTLSAVVAVIPGAAMLKA